MGLYSDNLSRYRIERTVVLLADRGPLHLIDLASGIPMVSSNLRRFLIQLIDAGLLVQEARGVYALVVEDGRDWNRQVRFSWLKTQPAGLLYGKVDGQWSAFWAFSDDHFRWCDEFGAYTRWAVQAFHVREEVPLSWWKRLIRGLSWSIFRFRLTGIR
jgi:hypothetical protein